MNDLPKYYLASLFENWLSLRGLCNVNSAFCNKSTCQFILSLWNTTKFYKTILSGNQCEFDAWMLTVESKVCNKNFQRMALLFSTEKYDYRMQDVICLASNFSNVALLISANESSLSQLLTPVVFGIRTNSFRKYSGQKIEDCLTGHGMFESRQIRYIGGWNKVTDTNGVVNIVWHGYGILRTPDQGANGSYEGNWINGVKHGLGKLTNEFGYYDGHFEHDKRCGHGKFRSHKGGDYEGAWLNDMRNGDGVQTYDNPSRSYGTPSPTYSGTFLDDKRDGLGTMKYANGKIYSGMWKNDMRHGAGSLTSKEGKVVFGMWEEDMLITVGSDQMTL